MKKFENILLYSGLCTIIILSLYKFYKSDILEGFKKNPTNLANLNNCDEKCVIQPSGCNINDGKCKWTCISGCEFQNSDKCDKCNPKDVPFEFKCAEWRNVNTTQSGNPINECIKRLYYFRNVFNNKNLKILDTNDNFSYIDKDFNVLTTNYPKKNLPPIDSNSNNIGEDSNILRNNNQDKESSNSIAETSTNKVDQSTSLEKSINELDQPTTSEIRSDKSTPSEIRSDESTPSEITPEESKKFLFHLKNFFNRNNNNNNDKNIDNKKQDFEFLDLNSNNNNLSELNNINNSNRIHCHSSPTGFFTDCSKTKPYESRPNMHN